MKGILRNQVALKFHDINKGPFRIIVTLISPPPHPVYPSIWCLIASRVFYRILKVTLSVKVKVKKCRKYENKDNTTCNRKKQKVRSQPKALAFAAYIQIIQPVLEPSSSDLYLNSSCCHCSIAFKITRKFTVKIIKNASLKFKRRINATKSYFDWIAKFALR